MSNTANVTMRLDADLLQRIDQAARREGQNRTEYILSWLPEKYDSPVSKTENGAERPSS